jgi:hypothetical protein
MKRSLPLCLALCLTIACGETPDPSSNNTTNNNPTPDMNNTTPDMTTTPDMVVTPTDMGDMNTTPTDMGMDMPNGGACALDETFKGQIGGSKPGEGGTFTTTNTYTSAGLKELNDLILAKHTGGAFVDDDRATASVNECDTAVLMLEGADQIAITGATVTSTYGRRVTIQDKDGAILMFLENAVDKDGNAVTLTVGQKLNFKTTGILRYGCNLPQIAAVADLEVVGGTATSEVYVQEMTGKDISVAEHFQQMVRVGGKLTAFNGTCGGDNKCFVITHGPAGAEKQNILRTKSMFITEASVGTCVNYVGPVSSFPGPLGTGDKTVQLDGIQFNWVRTAK